MMGFCFDIEDFEVYEGGVWFFYYGEGFDWSVVVFDG